MSDKKRILIVEDEAVTAIDLASILKKLGYKTTGFAFAGEEVLDKVDDIRPDLVLMDIHLSGDMDGIETAALIREKYDIPVVYATAYADSHTLNRSKTTDPFGYVLKPFNPINLQVAIEMAFHRHKAERSLREDAIRDPLTRLFNRRMLNLTVERELSRAKRAGTPVGVILLDIDHFKRLNDNFGHQAGDMVLRRIAEQLRLRLRKADMACRYGGEEFVLVMPEVSGLYARERMEELRLRVKSLRLAYNGTGLGTVTLSLGIAVYPEHGKTPEALLRAADAAMYKAKAAGRDRVVLAEEKKEDSP